MKWSEIKKAVEQMGAAVALALTLSAAAIAQTPIANQMAQARLASADNKIKEIKEDKKESKAAKNGEDNEALLEELRQMRQLIERLETRVSQLEAEKSMSAPRQSSASSETRQTAAPVSKGASFPYRWFPALRPSASPASKDASPAAPDSSQDSSQANPAAHASINASTQAQTTTLSVDDRDTLDFWRDTTVNVVVDGYYGYNFNRPLGGINLLRANDVLSNSFSLNQAGVIFERAPKVEEGRRFGARLDLMFGQVTETLQGSAVNELRPQVYRHIWQAYGSYVAPLGKGLTVDFGKFASACGYETIYAKDNFNYSRSYWLNRLVAMN